ncbi:MAG: DNA internalization-related competence protein ComEC/Rec2 [Vicinamibacteraceae bacterium]
MGAVAVLPALALLVGAAVGATWAVPQLAPVGLAGALMAWLLASWRFVRHAATTCVSLLAAGFVAAGLSLGGEAAREAWAPPGLERWYADTENASPEAAVSSVSPPIVLEGWIRADAEPTLFGASFVLDLRAVHVGRRRTAARGGVRVQVGGRFVETRSHAWRAGRLVRAFATLRRPLPYRNFGTTDQELALARRHVRLLASVKSALLVEMVRRGHFAAEIAASIRAHVRRIVAATVGHHDPTSAAIVTAVLMGDRAGLGREIEDRLQRAGTYHVLAISGGNIALLAALLFWLPRRLGVAERVTASAVILFLAGYAATVEGGASVPRATSVAIVYLSARLWDHRTSPMNALAVAAALQVASMPLALFDAGFALSFGATVGILQMASLVRGGWSRIREPPRRVGRLWRAPFWLLASTIAAEIVLMPVSALVFARVTFAGLILNFVAIPLMGLVQVVGLITVGLGSINGWLGTLTGFVAHVAALAIVESSRLVDILPWLVRDVPPPSWGTLVAYYGGLVGAVLSPIGRGRRSALALCALSAVWIVAGGIHAPRPRPSTWHPGPEPHLTTGTDAWLTVTFLDVGQGDATLLQLPDGATVLTDAGGTQFDAAFDVGDRVVSRALWALGLRRLDRMGITHGDADHVAGAPIVAQRFHPRVFWEGVPVAGHRTLELLKRVARGDDARWWRLRRGEVITRGVVSFVVLHPRETDWERPRARNNDSLVLDVRYGDVSFLLAGDIERETEEEVSAHVASSRLRVLKAAHHGSRTSTTARFLEAVRPQVVVLSCGRENRYGHPAAEVVARIEQTGASILRTDRDGAIQLATNGHIIVGRTMSGETFMVR